MPDLDDIRRKARPILEKYGVSKAAVFGSYARGEETADSDIDIVVKIDADLSLLDFVGLKQELEDALGLTVDLVEYHTVKPRIKEKVEREQVPLV
jgi:predicted nucleotidyltransferase